MSVFCGQVGVDVNGVDLPIFFLFTVVMDEEADDGVEAELLHLLDKLSIFFCFLSYK